MERVKGSRMFELDLDEECASASQMRRKSLTLHISQSRYAFGLAFLVWQFFASLCVRRFLRHENNSSVIWIQKRVWKIDSDLEVQDDSIDWFVNQNFKQIVIIRLQTKSTFLMQVINSSMNYICIQLTFFNRNYRWNARGFG